MSNAHSILFVLDMLHGDSTARVRGLIFREKFEAEGWRVEYVHYRQMEDPHNHKLIRARQEEITRMAARFDAVYLLKVPSLELVRAIKASSNARVIFDLTDALWRLTFHGWHDLNRILTESDAVFSENEFICEYGRRYNDRVVNIPASSQVEKFDAHRAELSARKDEKVVIGWIGSPSTLSAIFNLKPVLENICRNHPEVEIRLVGTGNSSLKKLEGLPISTLPRYTEEQMIDEVLRMDIGLFPPPGDLCDYRMRGALKAWIYMSAGVPPVCQNAGECRRVIVPGVTGMLAEGPEDWLAKIETLVNNAPLRREMGRRALESIRAEHSLQHVYECLRDALHSVIHEARHEPARRPPLLELIWQHGKAFVGRAYSRMRGRA